MPKASPVVIELFESQGCSSCPPAEKTVATLREQFGGAVIPLIFHVDYWDHPWKDTFSDAGSTERQKEYASVFHESSIYTPELVIQGETGFVGSDVRKARSEIQERINRPRPALSLRYEGRPDNSREGKLHILLPPDLNRQAQRLTLVVFENAVPVHVQRGENSGVTMGGDFAVRRISNVQPADSGRYDLSLRLDNAWNPNHAGVAVLIEGDSHQILAAEVIAL